MINRIEFGPTRSVLRVRPHLVHLPSDYLVHGKCASSAKGDQFSEDVLILTLKDLKRVVTPVGLIHHALTKIGNGRKTAFEGGRQVACVGIQNILE